MPDAIDRGVLLVLDDGKGNLGEASLKLVRAGISAMYANDASEGALLVNQEGPRIGGALLGAGIETNQVAEIVETVCPAATIQPEAIAVVGARPGDSAIAAYRELGLRWRLWERFEDHELIFMGSLALWEGNGVDLRIDLRAPVKLGAKLTCRGQSQLAKVRDLCPTGARLEIGTCLPPGRQVQLEVDCAGDHLGVQAFVRWSRNAREAERSGKPMGMGLEFYNLNRAAKRVLEGALESAFNAYRLLPPQYDLPF